MEDIQESFFYWPREPRSHENKLVNARFQTKCVKMTIVQCYILSNTHIDEFEHAFYNKLSKLVLKVPRPGILTVMGSFNAKVGNDNNGVERVVCQHGIEDLNQNGKKLLEPCEVSMCTANTVFRTKKSTEVSPLAVRCSYGEPRGANSQPVSLDAVIAVPCRSFCSGRVIPPHQVVIEKVSTFFIML